MQRIQQLKDAPDWNMLGQLKSLDVHPLAGSRRGQWALRLDHRWRLLVRVDNSTDTVTIEEVTQHYGD